MSANSPASGHPLIKPVSAYVGLLLAAVEDTREPGASVVARVARLPIATFGQLLTARRRYDELAEQGDVVLGAVTGLIRHGLGMHSADDDLDDFERGFGEDLSDGLGDDDASGWAAGDFTSQTRADAVTSISERSLNGDASDLLTDVVQEIEMDAELEDLAEEDEPAPPPSPLKQVQEFEPPAEVQREAGGLLSHDELPLPDFDHMTAPQLRGRLRRLDRVSLVQLLNYERAHANRLPIVLMLENRITKVLEDGDAGGSPQPPAPETPKSSRKRGPAVKPGPPQNPPSQGVPTNPKQPR